MWFDAIVFAALAIFAWRGASKGIVWQLATIAAILLCFAFAETLSLAIAPLITVQPPLDRWIAMFVLYLGFSFLSFAVARQVREWLEKAEFVEYDRHLGMLLGLIKGGLLCLLLTFFTVTLSSASVRDQILNSYSGKAAAIVMDRLHPVMPNELHDILEPYIHTLDQDGLDLRHHHADGESRQQTRNGQDGSPPNAGTGLENSRQTSPEEQGVSSRLHQLVRDLIGSHDDALIDQAVFTLRNTAEADRGKLLELLATELPERLQTSLVSWQQEHFRPAEPARLTQLTLLNEIAGFYFRHPKSQQSFVDDMQEQLRDLDSQIQLAVLQDLYADLINEGVDPDPQTNYRTPIEERIQRHVNAPRQASAGEFPFN